MTECWAGSPGSRLTILRVKKSLLGLLRAAGGGDDKPAKLLNTTLSLAGSTIGSTVGSTVSGGASVSSNPPQIIHNSATLPNTAHMNAANAVSPSIDGNNSQGHSVNNALNSSTFVNNGAVSETRQGLNEATLSNENVSNMSLNSHVTNAINT